MMKPVSDLQSVGQALKISWPIELALIALTSTAVLKTDKKKLIKETQIIKEVEISKVALSLREVKAIQNSLALQMSHSFILVIPALQIINYLRTCWIVLPLENIVFINYSPEELPTLLFQLPLSEVRFLRVHSSLKSLAFTTSRIHLVHIPLYQVCYQFSSDQNLN